ncbi:MAG: FecR domain-containing protein [Nitrospira sp.]
MSIHRLFQGLVGISLMSVSSLAFASESTEKGIGFYTAVIGQVSVTHPSEPRALPVTLHDTVLFKDVIQTHNESRTRAFFQDDSMLTVGENSRVEINEYVYDPDQNVRRAIVKLMQGQVRALVSKVFKANGSKFEVHTPSAVAAARGTYFTVWVANGQSGIINIGEKGRVEFTSGGSTVAVDPGFFSIAEEGRAPSVPVPHHLGETTGSASRSTGNNVTTSVSTRVIDGGQEASSAQIGVRGVVEQMHVSSPVGLAEALRAVDLTTLRDAQLVELPAHALKALSVDANLLRSLTTLATLTPGSSGDNSGTTTTGTSGTLLNGSLTVGSVSVATWSASGGTISVGSLSVGSTTVSVAPLTSVVSTVVAPVVPVISTVVAPIAPVITTIVAPVAPVISPLVAPVTPLVTTVLTTPPAVISGTLSLLHQ